MPLDGRIHYTSGKPWFSLCLWIAVFCVLLLVSAYVLAIILMRIFPEQRPQQRAHIHGIFCQPYHVIENVVNTFCRTGSHHTVTPLTWVPNPIARQIPLTFTTSVECTPVTTFPKRRVTTLEKREGHEGRTESEWLPSGRCAMDAVDVAVGSEDLAQDDGAVDPKDFDLDDMAYPCKGCGEVCFTDSRKVVRG
jgi:hypothetical protein